MSATTTLTRLAGSAAVVLITLGLSAGPSSAQTQGTPASGDTTTTAVRSTPGSGVDWTDVGSGALGGAVLAGGVLAAATALRRRQHEPRPA